MEDYWGIIYAIMKSLGINELEDYMIGKDIYKILLYKLRDLRDSDK